MNTQQFERNKYRILNLIEEELGEPLTPQNVRCNWKLCAESGGTTFQDRTKANLRCFDCTGYDTRCNNYMGGEE